MAIHDAAGSANYGAPKINVDSQQIGANAPGTGTNCPATVGPNPIYPGALLAIGAGNLKSTSRSVNGKQLTGHKAVSLMLASLSMNPWPGHPFLGA